MKLVIVESPAKAKRIAGFLGKVWRVEACRGHVRDLPATELGVDVDAGFRPQYQVLPGKHSLVRRLVKAIREADEVVLATDPDREGEAIAWHLLQLAGNLKDKPVYRAVFSAVTEAAVKAALNNPRVLDDALVEAQQARRIVDRLVGYLVSPVACKALDGRLSAGRVQSVALRLVVEREREIAAFAPETHWTVRAVLDAGGTRFDAQLHRLKDADVRFASREQASELAAMLREAAFWVSRVGEVSRQRQPLPPFTTATLQQAAAKGLGLSPDRTMALAQRLYEQGQITYHRTDGVSVSPEAQSAAREIILREYGKSYLPVSPPVHKAKARHAQEAHEAIRPVDVTRLPDEKAEGDSARLYALIWRRFVASQMAPARYTVSGALIHAGKAVDRPYPLVLRAQSHVQSFDGFLRAYEEPADEDEAATTDGASIPVLREGQPLAVVDVPVDESQTRQPPRFSEAGLVQALEQRGVGRPSTYAAVVKGILDKAYVTHTERQLVPTDTGVQLCTFLVERFPQVFDPAYTARLETALDRVATGELSRDDLLAAFWRGFQPQLKAAATDLTVQTGT